LSNALKFTAAGEIIITISFKKAWGKAQDILRFSVKDTGIGIPKEQ